jgi:cyclophilin family peptidyl-prolyl cis-trans isomerase
LSRRRNVQKSNSQQPAPARAPMLEPLEGRQLLASAAAVVTSTLADNRGYVEIRFNKALQSKTVTAKGVRVFTAGTDGVLGTSDDVNVNAKVAYSASKKTIVITGNVAADASYRVKLYSSIIKDVDGLAIDGEFKTGGKSGNGVAGGNYEFRVKRDTSSTPIMHIISNMGNIDVRMFRGASSFSTVATPGNVAALFKVVNAGNYDNAFVHRKVNNFVVQWGGLRLTNTGQVDLVPDLPQGQTITGEPGNSNVRGTLAFALGGGPDTADNELFFNVKNNNGDTSASGSGSNLDIATPNGGPFTVLGKITNSKGLAVLDAINTLHRLDLSTPLQGSGSDVQNVPVRSSVTVTGENPISGGTTTKTLNTFKDLVVYSRVSVL